MTARAFADGVAALLTGDAVFVAAVTALIGTPVDTVLRANTPVQQIPEGQWPCWIIEHGNGTAASIGQGDSDFLTIGNDGQSFESDLNVLLLWKDQSRDNAATTRAELSRLFAQLLLRNPTPGGIASAWLQEWTHDQGGQHPTHVFAAEIRGQYVISRS